MSAWRPGSWRHLNGCLTVLRADYVSNNIVLTLGSLPVWIFVVRR